MENPEVKWWQRHDKGREGKGSVSAEGKEVTDMHAGESKARKEGMETPNSTPRPTPPLHHHKQQQQHPLTTHLFLPNSTLHPVPFHPYTNNTTTPYHPPSSCPTLHLLPLHLYINSNTPLPPTLFFLHHIHSSPLSTYVLRQQLHLFPTSH
ncbi:hypothetical protein Pcinc_007683 [Petrolisthes cinctipes]|uniref:Uncharacterized protein n=1 Tax=Petrolisthes cinctipes TaxID=88211 RepID=A0AAE1GAK1_PETCI|nr:hypothetical protein Pcinc_007683 [Petrolisthes cinctipes]